MLGDILDLSLVNRSFILFQTFLCKFHIHVLFDVELFKVVIDVILFELGRFFAFLKVIFMVVVCCISDPYYEENIENS